ncbi:MAG: hypothetical protein VZQ47_02380 [Treponema sp.]|nr:hypothetical protein [Treponema sp.]
MTRITVKIESCMDFQDTNEYGFTIAASESGGEATLFDLSLDFASKLIPGKPVDDLLQELKSIDLQKVLWEDEKIQLCDGSDLILELENGSRSVTVSLNNPSMQAYKDAGCLESCKLLEFVQKAVKLANEHGVEFDLERE